MGRKYPSFFFYPFLNIVGDCFDLSIGVSLANYEEISGRIFEAAQVEFDDVLAFNIPDAFNDQFVQFFGSEPTLLYFRL